MLALLKIALRNVSLHWRHSLASLLSLMAAVISINVFQGYMQDLIEVYHLFYRNRSMYGDLVVVQRQAESPEAKSEPWRFSLTAEMQNALKKFADDNANLIAAKGRFLEVPGMVSNGAVSTIFTAIGYDDKESHFLRRPAWEWNTLYGKPFYLEEQAQGKVHLGQNLGKNLGCLPDPQVSALNAEGGYRAQDRPFKCQTPSLQLSGMTDSGQLNAIDVEVTGLIDAGFLEIDKRYLTLDLADAQSLLNTDRVSYYSFLLNDQGAKNLTIERFSKTVGTQFPELTIMPWQDHPRFGDFFDRTMSLLSIFRNFVIIVVIAISTLSVFNSMNKAMSERTREIGTLLSLGLRKKHIQFLFLSEASILGALGVALGGGASMLISGLINHSGIFYKAGMLSEPAPFRIALTMGVFVASSSMLILLTIITTKLALRRILAKRIIECLQFV